MSRKELQPCGTYAAWQRHRNAGEEPCEACWQAKRAYQAAYRKIAPRRPATKQRRARRNAEYRARVALTLRYPEAFADLLARELAKEGITQ